jgi:hypothetical protein
MTDRVCVPRRKNHFARSQSFALWRKPGRRASAEAERDTETRFTMGDALRAGASLDLVPSVTRRALSELVRCGHANWHGGELVFCGPEGKGVVAR